MYPQATHTYVQKIHAKASSSFPCEILLLLLLQHGAIPRMHALHSRISIQELVNYKTLSRNPASNGEIHLDQ